MISFAADDLADLRRWAISAAVVVLAHGGIAAAMVAWREPIEGIGAAAGIVIEFALVPIAPATLQSELPPGPEQDVADSSPSKRIDSPEEREKTEQKLEARLDRKAEERVETRPVEEPPPRLEPAPDPEVAIPPLPPEEAGKEIPPPQEQRTAAVATAPEVIAEQTAAIPAAPTPGLPNPYDSEPARRWGAQIKALIERNRRYPMSARSRNEQGIVQVFLGVDRQGRVTDSRIVRSSGVAALDEEALAVLRRAQPFPPPPREFPGDRVTVIVPLRFNLK